jgi:hypothetical protein
MRFYLRGLCLLAAALFILTGLVAMGWIGLGSMRSTLAQLWRQQEVSNQIDDQFQVVAERAREKDAVVTDLIEGRCDLRSAVARYQTLCGEADWNSLRMMYRAREMARADLLARHLIELVSQSVDGTPARQAQIRRRLAEQWSQQREAPGRNAV